MDSFWIVLYLDWISSTARGLFLPVDLNELIPSTLGACEADAFPWRFSRLRQPREVAKGRCLKWMQLDFREKMRKAMLCVIHGFRIGFEQHWLSEVCLLVFNLHREIPAAIFVMIRGCRSSRHGAATGEDFEGCPTWVENISNEILYKIERKKDRLVHMYIRYCTYIKACICICIYALFVHASRHARIVRTYIGMQNIHKCVL